MPDHGQHLDRHFLDDLVGVATGQKPRRRAAPGHPTAPGVTDDDQVDPARLIRFGGQAGACAAADDRLTGGDHLLEAVKDGLAGNGGHLYAVRKRKVSAAARAKAGSLM